MKKLIFASFLLGQILITAQSNTDENNVDNSTPQVSSPETPSSESASSDYTVDNSATVCKPCAAESGHPGSHFYIEMMHCFTSAYMNGKGISSSVDPDAGERVEDNYSHNFDSLRSKNGAIQYGFLAHLGFDCKLRNSKSFMGFFFGGGFSGARANLPYEADYPQPGNAENLKFPTVGFKEKGRMQSGMRFGFIQDSLSLYMMVGWSGHHLTGSLARMDPGTARPGQFKKASISKWAHGLLIGAGLEWALNKRMIVGLGYNMSFCPKKTYKFAAKNGPWYYTQGQQDKKLAVRLKPKFSTFTLSMKYAIPTCR